jgi:formamidopyrimidine-DNA glycosylase
MPELPEVEVIRRDLEKEVVGREIRSVEVRNTKNAMRVIRRHRRRRDLEDPLAGTTVTAVDRRGKYLVFHLDADQDLALVVHLGMSGQLLQSAPSAGYQNHTHVVFDLADGGQLRYVDPRTFGEMFVTTVGEDGEVNELRRLGLDPLESQLTWQHFSEFLSEHKVKLKSLLMDQRFVAGIGNIYSDEILYLAGLDPSRGSDTLSDTEVRRLYRAMQEVLQEAIRHRGTSADDEQYRDLYGAAGDHRSFLQVYQREGQPCRRCRTPIERGRWSNRSTYFCPKCQV